MYISKFTYQGAMERRSFGFGNDTGGDDRWSRRAT